MNIGKEKKMAPKKNYKNNLIILMHTGFSIFLKAQNYDLCNE